MRDMCEDWPALAGLIDQIAPERREWDKADVLAQRSDWREFVRELTGAQDVDIDRALADFRDDAEFQTAFRPRLDELDTLPAAGDLRFHSLTLYAMVRLVKPRIVVETGVASGKSSSMILLALHHNQEGVLHSVDLPNPVGQELPDGASTHTGSREVGWLVPDYLRERWRLNLGNSLPVLATLAAEETVIDIFMHDSLHTDEHVTAELETVAPCLHPGSVVLIDNADMMEGALTRFAQHHQQQESLGYRNLAGMVWR